MRTQTETALSEYIAIAKITAKINRMPIKTKFTFVIIF